MKKKQDSKELNSEVIKTKTSKVGLFQSKTIKDIIAPSGIDASNLNHLEIISHTNRLARSFYVSSLPRMGSFPFLLRDMYEFGDMSCNAFVDLLLSLNEYELSILGFAIATLIAP